MLEPVEAVLAEEEEGDDRVEIVPKKF